MCKASLTLLFETQQNEPEVSRGRGTEHDRPDQVALSSRGP